METKGKAKKSTRMKGVYKRGNKWCIRYMVQGKLRRESAGGTYEEAVKALLARKHELATGAFEKRFGVSRERGKSPTFNEFAERFLNEYSSGPGKRASLRKFHEVKIRQTLRRFFGTKRIAEIAQWDVMKFQAQRAKERSKQTGEPISPATVNREMAVLSKALNYAVRCGEIRENPCKGVERFREKRGRVSYLEPEECAALVKETAPHARPVIVALLHTGARKGDILGLDWRQVDMNRRQITLEEAKTADEEPEYLPIDGTLYGALLGLGPKEAGPVFVNRKGEPIRDIREAFKNAVRRSGIEESRRRTGKPPLRMHDLRHTAASLLAMSGRPIQDVQRLLRHRSITTTMRYAHLSPAHMQEVAGALDAALSTDTVTDTAARFPKAAGEKTR